MKPTVTTIDGVRYVLSADHDARILALEDERDYYLKLWIQVRRPESDISAILNQPLPFDSMDVEPGTPYQSDLEDEPPVGEDGTQ